MRTVFADWIDNSHSDLSSDDAVILKIELTDGILFSHGTRYNLDFS